MAIDTGGDRSALEVGLPIGVKVFPVAMLGVEAGGAFDHSPQPGHFKARLLVVVTLDPLPVAGPAADGGEACEPQPAYNSGETANRIRAVRIAASAD